MYLKNQIFAYNSDRREKRLFISVCYSREDPCVARAKSLVVLYVWLVKRETRASTHIKSPSTKKKLTSVLLTASQFTVSR